MDSITVFYTEDSVKITVINGLVFLNEKDIFSYKGVYYQVLHKLYDAEINSIIYKGRLI